MKSTDRFSVPAVPEMMPAVCPVTGLSIRSRPEWSYTNPDKTYRTTVALIGEAIFWVVPRGYITEADMAAATAMASDVLAAVHPQGTPFVFIENFSHTRGGTAAARRLYLQFTNTLPGLLGSFPYGMSPFFRFSFNFSRRLHLHRYNVRMVARYDDAVRAALEMLAQHGVFPGASRPVRPRRSWEIHLSKAIGQDAGDPGAPPAHGLAVEHHVETLLGYLGDLDLHSPETPAPPAADRKSPLAPVYEALATLKLDMDQYLVEHRELVNALQKRHALLVEKTAALERHNRDLQALLRQSSEDRAALGRTVRHNVETLLKPVLQRMERADAGIPWEGWLDRIDADIDDLIRDLHPRVDLHDYDLTPREMRIARMIRDGARSKDIARRLKLSVRTVESFRWRLRDKLGIRGRSRNLRTLLQAIPDEGAAADRQKGGASGRTWLDRGPSVHGRVLRP